MKAFGIVLLGRLVAQGLEKYYNLAFVRLTSNRIVRPLLVQLDGGESE